MTSDEVSRISVRPFPVAPEKTRVERYAVQALDTGHSRRGSSVAELQSCPDFTSERSLACVAPSPEHLCLPDRYMSLLLFLALLYACSVPNFLVQSLFLLYSDQPRLIEGSSVVHPIPKVLCFLKLSSLDYVLISLHSYVSVLYSANLSGKTYDI